jgi:hypothetical protein
MRTGSVCCAPYLVRSHPLLLESQYTCFHFVSSAKAGNSRSNAFCIHVAPSVMTSKFRGSNLVILEIKNTASCWSFSCVCITVHGSENIKGEFNLQFA